MDAITLVQQCAPVIEPTLAIRLLRRESGFNPYAIGLDGKAVLKPQPRTFVEAVKIADDLLRAGKKFSVGISQVHISNVKNFGLTWAQAFDPCTNLRHGQTILQHFHNVALKAGFSGEGAVFAALRGYNSGSVHASISNNYANAIMGGGLPASIPNVRINIDSSMDERKMPAHADAADIFSTPNERVRADGQAKEIFEE